VQLDQALELALIKMQLGYVLLALLLSLLNCGAVVAEMAYPLIVFKPAVKPNQAAHRQMVGQVEEVDITRIPYRLYLEPVIALQLAIITRAPQIHTLEHFLLKEGQMGQMLIA
jgi:hypothetical protein